MTWMSRSASATPAAAQMPSSRRRTMCERVLGGVEQHAARAAARAKRRRHGAPAATATARSRARNDLQHLGSPPTMPTACSAHRPVDEPAAAPRLRSARRQAGSTGSRLIAVVLPRSSSRRSGGAAQVSRNSFSSIWRASRCAATASSSPAMVISARGLPWA